MSFPKAYSVWHSGTLFFSKPAAVSKQQKSVSFFFHQRFPKNFLRTRNSFWTEKMPTTPLQKKKKIKNLVLDASFFMFWNWKHWEILNACINILFYVYKINYFLRITVDWTDTYRKYKWFFIMHCWMSIGSFLYLEQSIISDWAQIASSGCF